MRFTIDLERVIDLHAPNARHAALIADSIDSAIDRALTAYPAAELARGRTQAYRGTCGGCIYDSKNEDIKP